MSEAKKRIREAFRNAVFGRDGHKCVFCDVKTELDAHHITDRRDMPAGGYVVENGITLCPTHHKMAEEFHTHGEAKDGFWPEDLYTLIGTNHYEAYQASVELEVKLDRQKN